ncbi:MAG: hypothetical protein II998_11060 [Clostridia bacterium]|nr:hypothetical protein [Clostridia bacterium]
MYCKYCGNEIFDITKFCPNCGNPTEIQPVDTKLTEEKPNVVKSNFENRNSFLSALKSNKKLKRSIIALLVVAVIGIGGYLIYDTFFAKPDQSSPEALVSSINEAVNDDDSELLQQLMFPGEKCELVNSMDITTADGQPFSGRSSQINRCIGRDEKYFGENYSFHISFIRESEASSSPVSSMKNEYSLIGVSIDDVRKVVCEVSKDGKLASDVDEVSFYVYKSNGKWYAEYMLPYIIFSAY